MITDHAYDAGPTKGDHCLYNCGLPEDQHVETEYLPGVAQSRTGSSAGLRGKATSPEAAALESNPYEGKSIEELAKVMESEEYLRPSQEVVRAADAAQYARPAIPEEQRGQIRVRLLNATTDPLGSVAALCEQYKGNVIRSLAEVTDEQRRTCLDDMASTVLNGPLEAVQFHWQIEGITRSITHQMVRSRPSFFAQESLRFAVPEGNWAEEIPLPPSLAGARKESDEYHKSVRLGLSLPSPSQRVMALDTWEDAMINAQNAYQALIELGVPAEEARGVLPHDMPTRIHWVMDLRTLLTEAGKRTCTQAQFPWRIIFAGMAHELRSACWDSDPGGPITRLVGREKAREMDWQFRAIADRLRPVCFQTGRCGFMAKFDRSCKIRERVDKFAESGVPSSNWGETTITVRTPYGEDKVYGPIHDYEWAADPSAARS